DSPELLRRILHALVESLSHFFQGAFSPHLCNVNWQLNWSHHQATRRQTSKSIIWIRVNILLSLGLKVRKLLRKRFRSIFIFMGLVVVTDHPSKPGQFSLSNAV